MGNIGLIYRKKDTFTGLNGVNDLVEPELRKKIRITVLSVHLGLLLFLVLWYLIANFFMSKKTTVIQVTLVTPDKAAYTPTSPSPQPSPPVVKPKKRKTKRKVQPKPKHKTKPKPKKKKMAYLKPDQIKISRKQIKNDPVEDLVPLSADDLQKELTKKYRNSRIKTKTTQGNRPAGNISRNYLDQVSALMYQTWQQPGKSEIGNRQPTVDVEITVDASGRIFKARIVRKSGVSAMDISAQQLLNDLKALPRPPSGKTTFTVTLEIIKD